MVATASSAAADISSHVESVHPQFSATTEPVHNTVGVAHVRLGSDGSTGNRSESPDCSEEQEEHCAPMDLSSGGGGVASPLAVAGPTTFMMAAAAAAAAVANGNNVSNTPTSLADSLLNARRLAELVRAHQLRNDEAAAAPMQPQPPPAQTSMQQPKHESSPPMLPRKRAWPELQLDLSAMVTEKLKKKEDSEIVVQQAAALPPTGPASPAESSSSGGTATPSSNKEVKKRRLDQLLSKKFSVNDSPPSSIEAQEANEPEHGAAVPKTHHELVEPQQPQQPRAAHPPIYIRRDSHSENRKPNRRKRSSPLQSSSPVTLSLRPNSELLEPPHAAVPVSKVEAAVVNVKEASAEDDTEDSKNSLKSQLLQIHLAQAALLNQTSQANLFPGFPGLMNPGAAAAAAAGQSGNPLLYYGYYAQMIQGLQSQQQKLLEQLTGKAAAKNMISSSSIPISSKHQPKSDLLQANHPLLFQTPKSASGPSFSPGSRILASTPHSPPSPGKYRDGSASPHNLLSSPLSISATDEPRRRAPRALTGRYVKSGPGASPRVLAILRKKIEERLKLKELLGENSNLYFGALKQQKMKPKNTVANSRF